VKRGNKKTPVMLPECFASVPIDSPMQKSGWRCPFGRTTVVEKQNDDDVVAACSNS
jgi:hypothetical protein